MLVQFVHDHNEVIGRLITGWFLIASIGVVLFFIRYHNRTDDN